MKTRYMAAFFGCQSHFRPFEGNPNAAPNTVAITDVDACLFYGLCGTQTSRAWQQQPIFVASPTGFYLMTDLNRGGVRTPVSPNDVRFIINGAGAAVRFGTPFGNVGRNTVRGPDRDG